MSIVKEFREFALKGNVLDLAVGVIIGAAFGKIVSSLVEDVLMPPIGFVTGGIDFADKKIQLKAAVLDAAGKATSPEVAISYGKFLNTAINFLIVAACIFVVVKAFNTARKRFEAEQPKPPAPPPGPSETDLLKEIRDLLAKRA